MQKGKRKGNTGFYMCVDVKPRDRNHKTTVAIGQIAKREGNTIKGIKDPILADWLLSDLNNGTVPDYMHCVLLAVWTYRQTLWMKAFLNHGILVHKQKIMDRHFLFIKPPGTVTQVQRSLEECKFWKGHQWQHWLMYYSLPVLKCTEVSLSLGTTERGHKHSVGVWLKAELISYAHEALVYFVGSVLLLYAEEQMTFNDLSLRHLGKRIVPWGPLWAHVWFQWVTPETSKKKSGCATMNMQMGGIMLSPTCKS